MPIDTVQAWHRVLKTRDMSALGDLLADNAVFHSPVVHPPQVGKPLTLMYLAAAAQVLGNESFRYLREVVGPRDAALEFTVDIDGITVNGVDLIHWDFEGRIDDFKVMLRPLKAVNLVHQKMAQMLQAQRWT